MARQVGGQPTRHAQPAPAGRRRRLRAVRARGLRRGPRLPRSAALAQRRARFLAQVLVNTLDHSAKNNKTKRTPSHMFFTLFLLLFNEQAWHLTTFKLIFELTPFTLFHRL